MYELPKSIIIEDKEYPIRNDGDYRMVLDCFSALQDTELNEQERLIVSLAIFYKDVLSLDTLDNVFNEDNINELVQGMFDFFACNNIKNTAKSSYKLIDWEQDEQMIVSAINSVAGTEIRAVPYMHWFTFMSYYGAVGESTLSTVVGIRNKLKRGKKLEKYEQEFRKENPEYFIWNSKSAEDKEAEDWIRSLWNSEQ